MSSWIRTAGAALPRLLVLVVVSLLAVAVPAQAQDVARTVVGVPDGYPQIDADVVIVRQTDQDAVLLRPGTASLAGLRAALYALRKAREARPRPETGELIPIVGFGFDEPPEPSHRRWLDRILADLADAPAAELGSFGWGPRVVVEDARLAGR